MERPRRYVGARWAFAFTLIALVLSATSAEPARADNGEATLSRVADLVDRASRTSGAEQSALVAEALADLRADPNLGSSGWLREPLESTPPNVAGARDRVAVAIDGLRDPGTAQPTVDARQSLARVLADSRFHQRTWLDWVPAFLVPAALIVSAVAQFVWSIIRWPFDRSLEFLQIALNSPLFGPVVVVAALGVAAGVVGLYRAGLRSILVAQAEIAAPKDKMPPTAAEALTEARRRDSDGQYREACHFVLLATLLWIEEKGLARFNRSATNREHVAQLATVASLSDGRIVEALGPVINRFDRVWYGQSFVTDADYQDLLALAGRVRQALS